MYGRDDHSIFLFELSLRRFRFDLNFLKILYCDNFIHYSYNVKLLLRRMVPPALILALLAKKVVSLGLYNAATKYGESEPKIFKTMFALTDG